MSGIGLITNPRSGVYRRDPRGARQLGYLIGSQGTAEATASLDDLYRVCEEFKRQRIDVLGISGGDGTLHHTLTAMIRTYRDESLPPIAILRGGTMNTIARSFGVGGETRSLLFELVDKRRRGVPLEVFEHDVLQVGDQYGFIFGNGVIYNFMHEYYANGDPSPATAARLIARAAASTLVSGSLARRVFKSFHARVTADGTTWGCRDFVAVAASVVEQIGFGFKPFYRAHEQRGAFAVLGIHASPVGLVAELPRILAGKPMHADKVIDQIARELVFTFDDELAYILDGDLYRARGSLMLRAGPRLHFVHLTGDTAGELVLPGAPVLQ
jgi:diacylglycerol kinase family enzyme